LDNLIQQLAGEKVQWGSDWYSGYGKKNLDVSALELRGALLNLQGRQPEAIQLLQEGAQKEKELGYWEPPHYSRPVLESLAQVYLQAKKWEEARETYRQILRLRPNSGHARLGLARAFWGEGRKDHAAQAYAEFLQAWAQADATLPQIKEAKGRLANGGSLKSR
jgi:tetratricopeptide (TPR) repeat protein